MAFVARLFSLTFCVRKSLNSKQTVADVLLHMSQGADLLSICERRTGTSSAEPRLFTGK